MQTAPLLKPEVAMSDCVFRSLSLRSESVNEENRTFEAVVATESPVVVYDNRSHRIIEEVLVASGGEFPDRIVMLDDHQRWSGVNSVIGSAHSFRRQGDRWIGVGQVGRGVEGNPYREQLWQDVLDGHIRAVSIGYRVSNYVDIPAGQKQRIEGKVYEAGEETLRISTKWRAHELSLTPIGADSEALIRSQSSGQARPQTRSYFAL